MGFLNSALIWLMGLAYTFLGTPYAPIYSRVSFETMEPLCTANVARTRLDKELCKQVGWGQRDEWAGSTSNHFEVTSTLCPSANRWSWGGNNFSEPFNEAYFKNDTTWKSVLIRGPWKSVEKTLDCLAGNNGTMSIIEYVAFYIGRCSNT
jgi:hypothetical protein